MRTENGAGLWTRAVGRLRAAADAAGSSAVYVLPERAKPTVLLNAQFWETLLSAPAELNGLQCHWVQTTHLRDLIREVRDEDREKLGPLTDGLRFSGFAALF